MGSLGLWWGWGVRSFASANDTPPYPTMMLSERMGHPVWWLSTHASEARHGAPGFEISWELWVRGLGLGRRLI